MAGRKRGRYAWADVAALFARDKRGSVMVVGALLLPAVLGFGGLAVDTGVWYDTQQKAQAAADAAARAGAFEVGYNTGGSAIQSAALHDATQNGYANGTGGAVVTVNNPPKSGSYAGNANAVEVIVQTPAKLYLSSLFAHNFTIAARAVALMKGTTTGSGTGSACILALSSTNTGITANGNMQANMPSCAIVSDSTSSTSIIANGNATITASSLYTAGGILTNGNIKLNVQSKTTNGTPVADPYSKVTVPSYGGCNHTNSVYNSGVNVTLNPGVYCGGLTFNGQQNVTLNPGTYYITNGDFIANGGTTITCNCTKSTDGVTFVMTGSSPGNVTMNGNSTMTLNAPTDPSNPLHGFLFYQSKSDGCGGQSAIFNGNSNSTMNGTLYFPGAQVTWNGNSVTNANNACVQVIGNTVMLNGTANMTDTACNSQGAGMIYTQTPGVQVALVE
ncbi:MAG: hypothetical protein JO126_09185 [Alphaproteobacteria bacterium]|nr:hypothetical protein [Alphaproteobacteria bacterium]MBV8549615.1 hypothetical protein [Alphaproteobacteria bacterium]